MLEPPPLPPPSTEDPAPTPPCEWMVMPAIMLRIVASTRGGVRLVAKAEVTGVELEACNLGDVAVLVVVALVPELTGVMPLRASRHDREKGSGCDSVPNG